MIGKPATIIPVTEVPIKTTREHFSFSQLNMYLRCSMQYWFRYVMGRKERPRLVFARGHAGHTALEMNAKQKIETKKDQPLEQILSTFSDAYDTELAEFEETDFRPDDNPGKEKDDTVEGLRLYRGKYAPNVMPQAVELEFHAPVPITETNPDPILPIEGKIDVIQTQKRIVIPRARPVERLQTIDRKFNGRKPSNMQDTADMSDQLTMYDYVLSLTGKAPQDLGFEHHISPTKTIGPRFEAVYRSQARMRPETRKNMHQRMLYKVRTAIAGIKAGNFIPIDDPKICRSCGFLEMCQGMSVKDYDAMLRRVGKTPKP